MSTPTPDYGEPWRVDSARGVMDKNNDAICYPVGAARVERIMAERIVGCVNACAGIPDPAAHLAGLSAAIEHWESELSAVMPPDFKDWFQNDKSEWPVVARQVIESLREREAFCMRVIEHCEDTLKTMNDALKEAHRIFGNLNHSQVVQRLCPDFAEVAELVRKSHDQHA